MQQSFYGLDVSSAIKGVRVLPANLPLCTAALIPIGCALRSVSRMCTAKRLASDPRPVITDTGILELSPWTCQKASTDLTSLIDVFHSADVQVVKAGKLPLR